MNISVSVSFQETAKASFCKLPSSIAESLIVKFCVIKLQFHQSIFSESHNSQGEEPFIYVPWRGGISSSVDVELYYCSHMLLGPNLLSKPIVTAKMTVVDKAYEAQDVTIQPCTQEDWDLVSSQASIVEKIFLEQFNILYTSQLIQVRMSPSMRPAFLVTDIKISNEQSLPSDAVALLSTNTLLLVAPFSGSPSKQTTSTGCSDDAVEKLMLRVLPTSVQRLVMSQSNLHENRSNDNDNLVDTLLGLYESIVMLPARSETPSCRHSSDSQFVLINPGNLKSQTSPVFVYSATGSSCQHNLGFLSVSENHSSSTSSSSSPLTVAVGTSVAVRFGSVFVPTHIRKHFGIADCEYVTLHLLSALEVNRLTQLVPPIFSVTFCPVLSSSETNNSAGDDASDSSNIDHNDKSKSSKSPDYSAILDGETRINSTDWSERVWQAQILHALLRREREYGTIPLQSGSLIILSVTPPSSTLPTDMNAQSQNESIANCYQIQLDHSFLVLLNERQLLSAAVKVTPGTSIRPPAALDSIPSTLHSPSSSSSYVSITSQRKVLDNVKLHLFSTLFPLAVYQRIRDNIHPPHSVLITGPLSSGQSACLHQIAAFVRDNPQLLCHTEYLDLKTCGSGLETIRRALTEVYSRAAAHSPSVVCLDNVDSVAYAFDVETAVSLGFEHSNRGRLVALHLKVLVENCAVDLAVNHSAARQLYVEKMNTSDKTGHTDISGDEIVYTAMRGAVFTIATASDCTLVNPLLLSPSTLAVEIKLPALSFTDRVAVFVSAVQACGYQCTDELADRQSSVIGDCTRNWSLGDILLLGHRCSAHYTCFRRTDNESDDVKFSTQDFLACKHIVASLSNDSDKSIALLEGKNESATVTKASIGGYESTLAALYDVFLTPRLYRQIFKYAPIKLSRAALLYGPTGCGKSLLARAIAYECGFELRLVRGPELLSKYIGASEKAVRDLFDSALAVGHSTLLFFDEFDSLAPRRGRQDGGVTDSVVNQLLTLLDGVEATMSTDAGDDEEEDDEFNGSKVGTNHETSDMKDDESTRGEIYVIAGTTRPDVIDPALLRPGRIDRHVYVGFPSAADRASILRVLLRPLPTTEDVSQAILLVAQSERASYMTAADLKAVVSTAHLFAVQEHLHSESVPFSVTGEHLLRAIQESGPSMTREDRQYFESVYQKFGVLGEVMTESLSTDTVISNAEFGTKQGFAGR